eukprot:TRINITY_DN2373_c0_g1_i1.p1 TRINITY_DN2373_c0_g1~~TRINITY_DN2373_c0_g1_i1.p1  ORF type:complete len:626 (-),score=118.45 TRINITY_DN2373_c0_g1_i1:8-1885(-)
MAASSKEGLEKLLQSLHSLGQEMPACLISLTQVVQPRLQSTYRIPILGKMFSEVPGFLNTVSVEQLQQVITNPPPDVLSLRMLLDLQQIQSILAHLTYMELVHLTKYLSTGMTPNEQLEHLTQLQTTLQGWSLTTIRQYHHILERTPLHLERSTLLKLEPAFPIAISHLTIQLLKLPFAELEEFKLWMEGLPRPQLILLVNLLQMEGNALFEIKQRIIPEDKKKKAPSSTGSLKRTRADTETVQERFNLLRLSSETLPKQPRLDVQVQETAQGWGDSEMGGTTDFNMEFDDFGFINDLGLGGQNILEMPLGQSGSYPPPDLGEMNFGFEADTSIKLESKLPQAAVQTEIHVPATPAPVVVPPSQQLQQMRSQPMELAAAGTQQIFSGPITVAPDMNLELNLALGFSLRIQKQPPAQTVYQRICKPFPSVMLSGPDQPGSQNFFCEATIVRADNGEELPLCLDGSKMIRVQVGVFATFRKLKILATTAQQGCLFKIRFNLKKHEGNQFIPVQGVVCFSDPIEVFSHTYYLTNRKKNSPPPPPIITEVLPPFGSSSGGTRCVILGSNFIDSPKLRVRFGDVVVRPTFHESKTLICTTLPAQGPGPQIVTVSNDDKEYCQSSISFRFD